jgi:hypothetical protein
MILGLDISTAVVGMCWLEDDGSYCIGDHIDLRKVDGLIEKGHTVWNWFESTSEHAHWQVDHIFVEDKLSGFSGGRTSQQTMMKLAAFNGIVSYLWAEKNSHFYTMPVYLHPSTVKAVMKRDGLVIPKGADKKALTLEHCRRVVPKFPYVENRNDKPQPWLFDIADAYCVARAGFLKHVCGDQGR